MNEPAFIWSPLPGSQALAISCPCNEILYHGTRGPGKTDAQLMAFRKNVGKGYGAFWRGVIFDREYKHLDDLVVKSKRWFPQFNDGARWLSAGKDYKWVWPTGEELLFRVAEKESDYDSYHGHEYPFIGWNELTKQRDLKLYDALLSCNRSSFIPALHTPKDKAGNYRTADGKPLPEIPLVVFSTTNPYGAGHNAVKRRFIDAGRAGEVVTKTTEVFNPRTKQRENVVRTQVHIFGSYKENIYLSPVYVASLEGIKERNKREAWLYGNWDIVAGGALDDLWDDNAHIVPRFTVPKEWRIDRSFDWGSTQPFSVGWWTEATGEEVELDTGEIFCPPRGSLIRVHEWYGTKEIGSNEGLVMSAPDVAKGIIEREKQLLAQGWIRTNPRPGPADNAIRNVVEKESDSIEKKMSDNKVRWTESDKKPGSRKNGLQLIRDRMQASLDNSGPAIYFMDHCKATRATLPVLPRDEDDPDDVDTEAEDHVYDEIRYRVLASNNRAATSLKVKHAT